MQAYRRKTDESTFARLPSLLHRSHRLLDGSVGIDSVQQPDVGSRAQVLDRLVDAFLRKLGRACKSGARLITVSMRPLIKRVARPLPDALTVRQKLSLSALFDTPFRDERNLLPVVALTEDLTEQLLVVLVLAVHGRCVPKSAALGK